MVKAILVIGGGIAGIQASLDLAEKGIDVFLVEKTPSIGGRMAQLDKTFPTLDCSICILAPKMAECYAHENINVLTYSEIKSIEGEAPNFKVQVLKKARYVKEEACTGCGECVAKCPTKVPSEFDMGLSERKAIYIPFLQAVPRVMTIDREHCLKMTKDKCGACKKICKREAIDYDMKDEVLEFNVGAIIVATGFDVWDPTSAKEYGYHTIKNVFTSLEFERMLNAAGPTKGQLLRRSDDQHPKSIAWIQCVGSRNIQLGHPYCCSVCCTQSAKEAILSKEHDPNTHTYIFYKDIRTFGKGFYEFKERAEHDYKATFIHSDATVQENPDNNNVIVTYDEVGKLRHLEVDMVVLAVAMIPRFDTSELAKILGIDLDKFGYYETQDMMFHTIETRKRGIYIAGYCKSPMDIPDSISSASAAAAKASEFLAMNGGAGDG
jgi:heterodisulfide reductase subunit A